MLVLIPGLRSVKLHFQVVWKLLEGYYVAERRAASFTLSLPPTDESGQHREHVHKNSKHLTSPAAQSVSTRARRFGEKTICDGGKVCQEEGGVSSAPQPLLMFVSERHVRCRVRSTRPNIQDVLRVCSEPVRLNPAGFARCSCVQLALRPDASLSPPGFYCFCVHATKLLKL